MKAAASHLRRLVGAYPELSCVLIAAAIGLSVQVPLAWLAGHQGINVLLAVLVFATALTVEPAALRRLPSSWRPLLACTATGITVLPTLSWIASRIVAAGSLRDGVMAVGLAPCEIASVATTAMAGGGTALAAGTLITSMVATIALAGPILSLEAGHADIHPGHIVANLALVVALPLAVGLCLRARKPPSPKVEAAATTTATVTVAALVALIAAEVHLSDRYLGVLGALAIFLAVSAAAGWLLGRRSHRPDATAVLLTTSMRDFAIAASLATAAFGPAAAAPLGLYGILVLIWGTATAPSDTAIPGERPTPLLRRPRPPGVRARRSADWLPLASISRSCRIVLTYRPVGGDEAESSVESTAKRAGVSSGLREHKPSLEAGQRRGGQPVNVGVGSEVSGGDHGGQTVTDVCLPLVKP
jgi:predicted Na+-dependent transporter